MSESCFCDWVNWKLKLGKQKTALGHHDSKFNLHDYNVFFISLCFSEVYDNWFAVKRWVHFKSELIIPRIFDPSAVERASAQTELWLREVKDAKRTEASTRSLWKMHILYLESTTHWMLSTEENITIPSI